MGCVLKLPKMQMCFICIFCIVEVEYYKDGKFVLPIYKVKRGKFDWSDGLKKASRVGDAFFHVIVL